MSNKMWHLGYDTIWSSFLLSVGGKRELRKLRGTVTTQTLNILEPANVWRHFYLPDVSVSVSK